MLGVKLSGSLGTQMFQYAFIFARAKKMGLPFFLIGGRDSRILQYFQLSAYSAPINLCRYLLFCLTSFRFLRRKEDIRNSPAMQTWYAKKRRRVVYSGNFRSEFHFIPYNLELRHEFRIKDGFFFSLPYHLWQYHREQVDLHKKRIIIHATAKLLRSTYYTRALQNIPNLPEYEILILGDNIENLDNYLDFPHTILNIDSAIEALQAMNQAHILIMSNMDLSWWGAYLNLEAEQIFFPEQDSQSAILLSIGEQYSACHGWQGITIT